MKLILSIVSPDDAHNLIQKLMKAGYPVTKLATTGGFLSVGNVTILIGVDDDRVDGALEVIAKNSNSRRQMMPSAGETGPGFYGSMPVEVTVGGATVFVLNVDRFHKF